jgi:hypothetical protein
MEKTTAYRVRIWLARLFAAFVFATNMQCACLFIFDPASAVGAYQIAGPGATAALQGMGIAFVMWNATYPAVIWNPAQHRIVFAIVIAQQSIGLIGESILRSGLGAEQASLADALGRFVAFDAFGLALLICAFIITRPSVTDARPDRPA